MVYDIGFLKHIYHKKYPKQIQVNKKDIFKELQWLRLNAKIT